ncbi:hypothetical protein CROQUDRAFT_661840 [Cronartium quercuum f. sp. fusiforme G11]|uniref:Uncharacterized protein n=1 Tax=Cronartium quercuum f. sp. fusiforme G11 TaxID=708437 RepID=A0A9P6NB91_9BASI|nr:hypothetical protein CROQUDRAFT_661840 [Cronartium quercuum f. sp. fusiforme G11]
MTHSNFLGLFNLRLIVFGLILGLGTFLLSTLRSYLFQPTLTPDHQTWHIWQKLQHLNPVIPNHDPENLGIPPPEDLVARRAKVKAETVQPKMPLPKKIKLHSDEL